MWIRQCMEEPHNTCEVLASAHPDVSWEKSDARAVGIPVKNILILDLCVNETPNNANKLIQFKSSPTDGLCNKGIKITEKS